MDKILAQPLQRFSVFTVDRLKLAAWLYINHQQLIARTLDDLGQHIIYTFIHSGEIETLADQWINNVASHIDPHCMAIFAEAVSAEIRVAAKLRLGEDISGVKPARRLKKVCPEP